MIKFKDIIQQDTDKIFLNTDELAEDHVIEGSQVRCICTNEQLNQGKGSDLFGAYSIDLCIMAKSDELPQRRGYGMNLNVDGMEYTIISWTEEFEMSTILLTTGIV